MPIVDQQLIQVYGNEDLSINFLEELGRKRCINLHSFVSTSGEKEKEQLHDMVKRLVGEKVIKCDADTCCISENYYSFVGKLNNMRE